MYRYQALLFDLFHTLVDVAAAPDAAGRYTADVLGVGRDEWNDACFSHHHAICAPTRHIDTVRALAHSIDPAIPERLIEEATAERQRRFDHCLRNVDAQVLETLAGLREQGFRIALVSNASTGEVSAWPDSPLAPLFDAAVFSCHCGSRKPQPAIYREALTAVGAQPAEALFIGDGGSSEHLGARELGIDSVLVTGFIAHRPERVAQRRAQVRWEVEWVTELPGLLDRIGSF